MAQRYRLMGITVLSILLLTIVGAVSISRVYPSGPVTITLNISPNPALPNQAITFSGQVTPPLGTSDSIAIKVFTGSSCAAIDEIGFIPLSLNLAPFILPLSTFTGTAQTDGSYSITATSGLPAGTYAARAFDTSYTVIPFGSCDPFTVAPPIPEYPFGLAVLAVFMLLGYGVIRRKTITIQE